MLWKSYLLNSFISFINSFKDKLSVCCFIWLLKHVFISSSFKGPYIIKSLINYFMFLYNEFI